MRDEKAWKWLNENELSYTIWNNKYRYNNESFDEWLDRVSGRNDIVKDLILQKKFIFGGRILANRGLEKSGKKITLSNCYVISPPDDNIESIFETASKLARTYSYGGGCGVDVSKLRPKNSKVNNASKSTTGCTSFMDFFSYVTGLIGQEGRRGALMLSINCTHPDLEEFINLKSNLNLCTKANISVKVSDDFMNAVINDKDWTLSFNNIDNNEVITKTVKAKDIFKLLAQRNWEMAEPGILYWDNITNYNMLNTNSEFKYAGVNPCAEEPLPAGGSCLLGSINLSEFVINPFTNKAYVDFSALEAAVVIAIRALNDVLIEGLSLHPLKEQRDSVYDWKQIGLGTMGLGDMLIKLGYKYGSKESISIISEVFKEIACTSVITSLEMAKELGCYPKCNKNTIAESSFITSLGLPTEIIKDIKKYGLYNSQLLTCAPTGSIGTMLECSTGVEPNFAFEFNRRTVSLNKEETTYKVYPRIVNEYRRITGKEELPDYFISSQKINPIDRILVQSTLQQYIDASISSTINLPENTTVDQIYDIYIQAWKKGLKGVTIYRDNCQRQGILTTKDSKKDTKEATSKFNYIEPVSRKKMGVTYGATFCKKCACGTLYISCNRDRDGNLVEVFTHTSKGGICQANLNAETRMASLALRSGVKVSEVIDQLKGITCPACTTVKAKGGHVDGISCADIIAKTIQEFQNSDVCIQGNTSITEDKKDYEECPECHEKSLIREGGCKQCLSCGYSKCE